MDFERQAIEIVAENLSSRELVIDIAQALRRAYEAGIADGPMSPRDLKRVNVVPWFTVLLITTIICIVVLSVDSFLSRKRIRVFGYNTFTGSHISINPEPRPHDKE